MLYSATKQQAERLLRRLKDRLKPDREYLMVLRRDVYRADTKLYPIGSKYQFIELKVESTFR